MTFSIHDLGETEARAILGGLAKAFSQNSTLRGHAIAIAVLERACAVAYELGRCDGACKAKEEG